jgi:hypothetical protein
VLQSGDQLLELLELLRVFLSFKQDLPAGMIS